MESTSRCSPLCVVAVEEWGFVFRLERGVLVFTEVSTATSRPTQPPTHLTPVVKGPLPCSVKVKNAWSSASFFPTPS